MLMHFSPHHNWTLISSPQDYITCFQRTFNFLLSNCVLFTLESSSDTRTIFFSNLFSKSPCPISVVVIFKKSLFPLILLFNQLIWTCVECRSSVLPQWSPWQHLQSMTEHQPLQQISLSRRCLLLELQYLAPPRQFHFFDLIHPWTPSQFSSTYEVFLV